MSYSGTCLFIQAKLGKCSKIYVKILKTYGKSSKNMGGLYIGHLYRIIERNTRRKNGIKVRCCMEGACKSV